MATEIEKREVFKYWNSKGIVVHRAMTPDIKAEITRNLKYYSVEQLKELIDFYATILEPGVPEVEKKYFWTHKWNLYEFLLRGVRKFEGQELKAYLRKQRMDAPEAVVFKRNK